MRYKIIGAPKSLKTGRVLYLGLELTMHVLKSQKIFARVILLVNDEISVVDTEWSQPYSSNLMKHKDLDPTPEVPDEPFGFRP